MCIRKRLHSKGFTLMELLLVVAIVGLLLALMMPTLSASRRRVDTVSCINNARKIVQAWHLYTADSDDRLVVNVDGLFGGWTNWVAGNATDAADVTNLALLVDRKRTLLAPYLPTAGVYKCPADEGRHCRSVSMNCRLNPHREQGVSPRWIGGQASRYRVFRRVGDLVRPSSVFVTLDEASASINDAYFAVDLSHTGSPDGLGSIDPYQLIDIPSIEHEGGGVFSFADGSASRRQWKNPDTFRSVFPRSHIFHPNPDIEWLHANCSHE